MKHLNLTVLIAILLYFQIENSEAGLISPIEKPIFETTQSNSEFNKNKIKPKPTSKVKEKIKLKTTNKFNNKKNIVKKPTISKKNLKSIKTNASDVSTSVLSGLIPPTKPLLLGFSKKTSTILKDKDFSLAKKTFAYVKRKSWNSAFKTANKSSDRLLLKIVTWMYLKETNNNSTFRDYKKFIDQNQNWPRISRLRYLAEHKINYKNLSPLEVINFFKDEKPYSGYGYIRLGEAYIIAGNTTLGVPLIKKGFTTAKLTKSDLRYLSKKYRNFLTSKDFIKRADYMAWKSDYWELNRTVRYLPRGYKELYHARFALMTRSYGVDSAISKVPAQFKNDIGLQFDRMKWRRKRGRYESALEIINKNQKDPALLIKPENWFEQKFIIARKKIDEKKYADAYELLDNHGVLEISSLAKAEWHLGWLALSFLDKPDVAIEHFKKMYNAVGYPISKSRGAYWIGRGYEKINNLNEANKWFKIASEFNATFYGQLSASKIGKEKIKIINQYSLDKQEYKKFLKTELARAAILLYELKRSSDAKDIIKHFGAEDSKLESRILAGALSQQIERFDYAIQISKQASYEGISLLELNYPTIETPGVVAGKEILDSPYILALIRQESEFDASANSWVGARGLMQIMPATGKILGKRTKLGYSIQKLTTNEYYNVKLGSYYITQLYENFGNNIYLALAAYNAGPHRVSRWLKKYGDPRKNEIDTIDFLEHIRFEETRNYVQRVVENIHVYKYILENKPINNEIQSLLYN